MKTASPKPADITRKWYVMDASQLPLGRLATKASQLLIGKGKPNFARHIDVGDFVIIINARQLVVTGNKAESKTYYRHSGYPGGLKQKVMAEVKASQPEQVIYSAVRGMLPVNKLRDGRLKRLKVYAGAEHNHTAQQPETIPLKEVK